MGKMTDMGTWIYAFMEKEAKNHELDDLANVLSEEQIEPSTPKERTTYEVGATRVVHSKVTNKYYSAEIMTWIFVGYSKLNNWLDEGKPSQTHLLVRNNSDEPPAEELNPQILIFIAQVDLNNVDDELMTNLKRATGGAIAETEAVLLKGSSEKYPSQYERLQAFCNERSIEIIETEPGKEMMNYLGEYKERYGMNRLRELIFAIEWPNRQLKPNPTDEPEQKERLSRLIASMPEEVAEFTNGAAVRPQVAQFAGGSGLGRDGDVGKLLASAPPATLKSLNEWPPSEQTQLAILETFGDILNDKEIFAQVPFSDPSSQPSTSSYAANPDIRLSAELTERLERTAASFDGGLIGFMSSKPNIVAQLESLAMSDEIINKLREVGLATNLFTGKPIQMKKQGQSLERDERVAFAEQVSRSLLKKLGSRGNLSSSDENVADEQAKVDEKNELAAHSEDDDGCSKESPLNLSKKKVD